MVANFEMWRKNLGELEFKLRENSHLKEFQSNTGIPLTYIMCGVVFSLLISMNLASGARTLSNIICVAYPFYMSLKVLYKNSKEESLLYLSYWIWYGIFTLIENIRITHLILSFIPFYYYMKMMFFIYLYSSSMKGSLFLYHKLLLPLTLKLERYESMLIKNVQNIHQQCLKEHANAVSSIITNSIDSTADASNTNKADNFCYDKVKIITEPPLSKQYSNISLASSSSSSSESAQPPPLLRQSEIQRSESESLYRNYPIE